MSEVLHVERLCQSKFCVIQDCLPNFAKLHPCLHWRDETSHPCEVEVGIIRVASFVHVRREHEHKPHPTIPRMYRHSQMAECVAAAHDALLSEGAQLSPSSSVDPSPSVCPASLDSASILLPK